MPSSDMAQWPQSGLAGNAANCGKDCLAVTYQSRIKNTPLGAMYGEKKDISKFRPNGCSAWMYLNEELRETKKTTPRAVEVVNLGFASDLNTSAYKVDDVKRTGQILTSNQLEFDEIFFPFWKEEIVEKLMDVDEEIDIRFKASAPIQRLVYNPAMRLVTFKRVSMGLNRHLIHQSPTEPNAMAFLSIDQKTLFGNLMATTPVHQRAMMAVGSPSPTKGKGLWETIDRE